MRLKTLLDYQRAFETLRSAELSARTLTPKEYTDSLKAKSMFDLELDEFVKPYNLEIENEAGTENHPPI